MFFRDAVFLAFILLPFNTIHNYIVQDAPENVNRNEFFRPWRPSHADVIDIPTPASSMRINQEDSLTRYRFSGPISALSAFFYTNRPTYDIMTSTYGGHDANAQEMLVSQLVHPPASPAYQTQSVRRQLLGGSPQSTTFKRPYDKVKNLKSCLFYKDNWDAYSEFL